MPQREHLFQVPDSHRQKKQLPESDGAFLRPVSKIPADTVRHQPGFFLPQPEKEAAFAEYERSMTVEHIQTGKTVARRGREIYTGR